MSRRLLLSYLLLALFVLAVAEIPLGISYARMQRNDLRARLEHDAAFFATESEALFDRQQPAAPRTIETRAIEHQRAYGERYIVVDKDGMKIVDSAAPGARPVLFRMPSRPEIGRALRGQVASGTRSSQDLGEELMYVAVPVSPRGVVKGAVRVTLPTTAIDGRIHDFWGRLAIVAAIILAAAALVGLQLARSLTRPLQRLEQAASAAGQGDLSARADTDAGPPEMRSLAASFNETVAKLETLIRAQEEFVADAAHQLRTPLAALQLGLENLDRDVAPEGKRRLETLTAEVARLSRLVDGLLTLARADAAQERPPVVDLGPIVDQRLEAWDTYAAEAYVLLARRIGEGLTARATPERVEQALDNLLANAVEVSPRAGTVTVSARRSGPWVELHVIDEGPGMPAPDRARAFDRLWRARQDSGGSGLGLAIVKRLATADGGEAELLPAANGGIDAVIRLRGAAAPPDVPGPAPPARELEHAAP